MPTHYTATMPTPRTKRPSPYEAARPLPSLWLRDDMDHTTELYTDSPDEPQPYRHPPRPG